MADREKVIKGLEDIQKHLDTGYSFAISWKSELIRDALELLEDEEELGEELGNAVELIRKKEEKIKELKKQLKEKEKRIDELEFDLAGFIESLNS